MQYFRGVKLESMKSTKALEIIEKMKNDLSTSGIVVESIVEDLKQLRPIAIEEEDPSLTKVIRLTYEHIEKTGSFNIPIPEEVDDEEEEEMEETPAVVEEKEAVVELDLEGKHESLNYLLSIMSNCDENELNREDLIGYRNRMMEY
jgi:hypothetical protein